MVDNELSIGQYKNQSAVVDFSEIYRTSSRLTRNYEADASEFLVNLKEIIWNVYEMLTILNYNVLKF